MLYFFLMNCEHDRFESHRFGRIRRFITRILNIALAGLLVFTLTAAFLLALRSF